MSDFDNMYGNFIRTSILVGVAIVAIFLFRNELNSNNIDTLKTDRNKIIMYSQTTCGYCDQKREQLTNKKINFTEYFVDRDRNRENELFAKLASAGLKSNYYTTPTFDVYGVIMPHNPSMQEIERNIRKYSTEIEADNETGLRKYQEFN
ncbi:MAG: glutaredoxin domain-containing protein [Pseudomonadota bacterium]